MVHVLLKPGLENFKDHFTSMWEECNCVVIWAVFGIALLWDWNENDLFQSCGHCWIFQICWQIECSTFTASSFRIWNSSTGIPSSPLALFLVMLPKAHLTSHSRMSGSRWVITPLWLSVKIFFVLFFCVFLPPLLNIFCFCQGLHNCLLGHISFPSQRDPFHNLNIFERQRNVASVMPSSPFSLSLSHTHPFNTQCRPVSCKYYFALWNKFPPLPSKRKNWIMFPEK